MPPKLHFHGATGEVTGSMHLVEHNGHIIALDCGLFQGRREDANKKNRSFPVAPSEIDAVILSHAHIDHCGKLPRLVKEGFDGPIFATPATCDLVKILLSDSAHIQEEDAKYWNKKCKQRGRQPIEPLYSEADACRTYPLLQPRRLGETFSVADGIEATLHEAGHMLGSAGVLVELDTGNGKSTRIVFTGDLGREHLAILRDPDPLPVCDYLICESTYGGRMTPENENLPEQFAEIVNQTVNRGGKLIVPAFAVGRTQAIAYHFHHLVYEGYIKEHIPMVVDSPLASKATEIFRKNPQEYDMEAVFWKKLTGHLFKCDKCEYTKDVEESKALHWREEPMIIISASGMCEHGRILHHLKNNIEDPRNTILIVGWAAAHTLARKLVEGHKTARIFGDMYDVKAQVKKLNGFSAHANRDELAQWTAPLAGLVKTAFLVHGETEQTNALADTLAEHDFAKVCIPRRGQIVNLD